MGGGIRIPKLQSTLKEHMAAKGSPKLELSMHLNGDEAMAQGAAFFAANISTQFKVTPTQDKQRRRARTGGDRKGGW